MTHAGVSFIGSGNVATHLARSLRQRGVAIHEICNPNQTSASRLATDIGATAQPSLDLSSSKAKIVIICTPDRLIPEVAAQVKLSSKAILVHTSGSASIDALLSKDRPSAVLYPLQTFTMEREHVPLDFPILIEGTDARTQDILFDLATLISPQVIIMNSTDRQIVHLAAVFANNFVNNLLNVSEKLLTEIGLDLEILKPLVTETVNKAYGMGPHRAQTGPARRSDKHMLELHRQWLGERLPQAQQIYLDHSRLIQDSAEPDNL